MNTRDLLLRTFAPLLGAAPLIGCGDTGESADFRASFSQSLCDEDNAIPWVHDLNPSREVDYRALRHTDATEPPFVVDEVGQACRTGSSECLIELEKPVSTGFIYWQFYGAHVALTNGDQVEILDSHPKLLEFLGDIDTAREAALVAYAHGYTFDCEGPNWEPAEQGFLLYAKTGTGCGHDDVYGHRLLVDSSGSIDGDRQLIEKANPQCVIGRLPQGLMTNALPERHPVGCLYAELAHLEAAAVYAFAELENELELHRAPGPLRARARRARHDEARHARLTGAVARRYGARPTAPRVKPMAPRSLEELAIDNVREGMIRETFGALVAHHQARFASDPTIAAVARSIASDETDHAALSWDLMAWLMPRLTKSARQRVLDARATALREFKSEFCREPDPLAARASGMPAAATSQRFFEALERQLWS